MQTLKVNEWTSAGKKINDRVDGPLPYGEQKVEVTGRDSTATSKERPNGSPGRQRTIAPSADRCLGSVQ
jgi:hypothetical protein